MKRFFVLSVFALSTAALAFSTSESQAQPKGAKQVINSGNAKATGGNGGNATGAFSKAGNGGSATALAGNLIPSKGVQQVINSGNATATGGNGGNAKGLGSTAGNGGGATALSGNLTGIVKKGGTTTANAGNATATGGNGGNASGPGSKGGNGGDAIAVSGNGNIVVNGNGNTVNVTNVTKVTNNNISFAIGGGGFGGGGFGGGGFVTSGPLAIAGGGGDGFVQGSPGIAIASAPGEVVIRQDGAPAVAVGQPGKDSSSEDAEKEEVFTRRMLKIKNESDVPVKVFVQYREMVSKKWQWLPSDPSQSSDAVSYDLKPGQEMLAEHQGKKVAASRVRIWVASEKAQWNDYKDADLWLVPEMDAQGQHRYLATEMKTFTFVVPAPKAAN